MSAKPRKPSRRHASRSRGQAMVEFALVIPVFLLILAGLLDFGFMLYSRMGVINASREGARAAVTAADPTTIPSVATGAARNSATGIGSSIAVSTSCVHIVSASCDWSTKTSSQPGDAVAVTVTYTYHTFFPLFFGATIPMSSTVQMVLE